MLSPNGSALKSLSYKISGALNYRAATVKPYSSVPNKRNSHNKSTKEPPTLKLISATHKISTTGDQFQFFQ